MHGMPGRRALLVAFGLAILGSGGARAQASEVVRIGFASPLTGAQAHYGKDNQNGARMAIDDLNARGMKIGGKPVRFELLVEDDQADPKVGTVVAQKLIDAGIHAMVGHFNSGVTLPASKLYFDAGIPQVSVSTNVKYTRQKFKTAFRIMADDDKQGAALGQYATQKLQFKRFAVIDDRTAYGQGLADAFTNTVRAAKAQVVKREFTNDKAVDFRNILTSIRKAQPDAIFFGGYDAQAGPMAKQMKELGIDVPLLGGETMNTAKFLQLAGPAAEGHIASTPGAALESRPTGKAFRPALPGALQAGHRPLRALFLRCSHGGRGRDGTRQHHGNGKTVAGLAQRAPCRRHRRYFLRQHRRIATGLAVGVPRHQRQVGAAITLPLQSQTVSPT